MRKLLSMLIVSVMLLCITACQNTQQTGLPSQQPSTQPSITETTQPSVPVEIQQQPMNAISLVPCVEETMDDNGNVRFIYAYQTISLVMPEPEIADKIILDHLNRMDLADQYADSLRTESLLQDNGNADVHFMYKISYTPKRFDNAILSMQEEELVQSGGAHPNVYGHFYTYDLLTGETLKLSEVLTENVSVETLANSVISNLTDTDGFYQGFEDTIKDMFKVGTEQYKYWYFSANGLCFYFDPYVVAPYAAGPITSELPYSQLSGILKDKYFPAEEDSYSGSLSVEEFAADTQSNYTQFAEAVLTQDGPAILLSADGLLTDIRIETVEIENNIKTTVMAVHSLSPGDGLMLQFDPAATKLTVNYHNGEQVETKTITYRNQNITVS